MTLSKTESSFGGYLAGEDNLLWMIDVGITTSVGDGIARIGGVQGWMAGELLEFTDGTLGMALNLEKHFVGVVLFAATIVQDITEGTSVRTSHHVVQVPVGGGYCGRIVGALGDPIDGAGAVSDTANGAIRRVEAPSPDIMSRKSVHEPFATGITAIDAMIPIGRGQRELVIGDRQTGKSTIAIDSIINQDECVCIYIAIGQKASTVAQLSLTLSRASSSCSFVIVTAGADAPATLQFLAPYTGATLAEHFMYAGQPACTIYDDLTKHAQGYREMCLLLRRPPAREAYPGDVFYLHSRLLERAAKLSQKVGSGSMTSLPIVETQEGDVSAYIPTNVISITDGQLFFSTSLFNSGQRPAINVGISVSRVGSAAQPKAIKQVAGQLKLQLAQFAELQAFSQFASDLDATTQQQLARGRRLRELMKQAPAQPYSVAQQVLLIFAGTRSAILDQFSIPKIEDAKIQILKIAEDTPDILDDERVNADRCERVLQHIA